MYPTTKMPIIKSLFFFGESLDRDDTTPALSWGASPELRVLQGTAEERLGRYDRVTGWLIRKCSMDVKWDNEILDG
jgi:hypothetical protein